MLQAAAELLSEKDLADISFHDIAKQAGIPKSSAYHFYANVTDLYGVLTTEISKDLLVELSRPVFPEAICCWQDIIAIMCQRSKAFYTKHAHARQLLIGGNVPVQFKRSDRNINLNINLNIDRPIGATIKAHLEAHFVIPDIPNALDVFFYAVEITDLMYCLSMTRHNCITEQMGEQAYRAGEAYLRSYLLEGTVTKIKEDAK